MYIFIILIWKYLQIRVGWRPSLNIISKGHDQKQISWEPIKINECTGTNELGWQKYQGFWIKK